VGDRRWFMKGGDPEESGGFADAGNFPDEKIETSGF
jgi:hypothetical protein